MYARPCGCRKAPGLGGFVDFDVDLGTGGGSAPPATDVGPIIVRTDPEGSGQIPPQGPGGAPPVVVAPGFDPGDPGAYVAPGAGEGMLEWIMGAVIAAALVSRG